MKSLLFLPVLFCATVAMAQSDIASDENGKVLLNNDHVKVVEFVSEPKGNVCGPGLHTHKPHLTVALTDAKVLITTADGKKTEAEIPAGAAIWFKGATHTVINTGKAGAKLLLIYPKD